MKTSIFFAIATATAALASPVKRTVAQVEADITDIGNKVTALDNAIKSYTGGAIAALSIHSDAQALESSLNSATTDVQGTTGVSEADGQAILNQVNAIVPTIQDSLKQIAAKEPALKSAGVASIAKSDLSTLATDSDNFANALIAAAPADLKAQGQSIKSTIDSAFATAEAAFASD